MHALTYVPAQMCEVAMAGGQEETTPRTAEDRGTCILAYSESSLIIYNKISLVLTFNLYLGR